MQALRSPGAPQFCYCEKWHNDFKTSIMDDDEQYLSNFYLLFIQEIKYDEFPQHGNNIEKMRSLET